MQTQHCSQFLHTRQTIPAMLNSNYNGYKVSFIPTECFIRKKLMFRLPFCSLHQSIPYSLDITPPSFISPPPPFRFARIRCEGIFISNLPPPPPPPQPRKNSATLTSDRKVRNHRTSVATCWPTIHRPSD